MRAAARFAAASPRTLHLYDFAMSRRTMLL
jgi:hypothetical protein